MKQILYSVGRRTITTATRSAKAEGDISAVFPSLSGQTPPPLPQRFAELKRKLIRGNEDAVQKSWVRLLASLEREIEEIKTRGSEVGT